MRIITFYPIAFLAIILIVFSTVASEPNKTAPIRTGEHYEIYGRVEDKKLVLEVVPTDGWKLNLKAPLKLKISSSDSLKPEREIWTGRDARRLEEKLCRLEIPLLGTGPGVFTLEFDFVVCTDTLCQKKKFSMEYRL